MGLPAAPAGAALAAWAFFFGWRGASMRRRPEPRLCTIGSPSFVTVTSQNRLLVSPGGVVGSVLMRKMTSSVSFVIVAGSVVALFGRPTSVTVASPSKSAVFVNLATRATSWPCSTRTASSVTARKGSATASFASPVEAVSRFAGWPRRMLFALPLPFPLPTGGGGGPTGYSTEVPSTTIFQVVMGAPPLALSGIVASSLPSGMRIPPFEAMPGGFQGSEIAIGAVKPGFLFATTFRSIVPFLTMGTFGSTTSSVNGTSSVTATARASTVRVQNGVLFWPRTSSAVEANSVGTTTLGSAGWPVTWARVAATGASAEAENTTGRTLLPAVIASASNATPEGRPEAPSVSAPPKSTRAALMRIARRLPRGTATTIGWLPRWGDSFGVLRTRWGDTGPISTR